MDRLFFFISRLETYLQSEEQPQQDSIIAYRYRRKRMEFKEILTSVGIMQTYVPIDINVFFHLWLYGVIMGLRRGPDLTYSIRGLSG